MPKKYTGRYVIYVKEGVYEEYVTITKKMANVTMYGDGAKKTIITGNRNFVDGRPPTRRRPSTCGGRVHGHRAGVPEHGRRGEAPGGGAAGAVGQVHLPQLPHGGAPGHALRALQGAVLPQLRHLRHRRLHLRRRRRGVAELRSQSPPPARQPAEHRHGAGPRRPPRGHRLRAPALPLRRRVGAQGRLPPRHPQLPRTPVARVLAHPHHELRYPRLRRQGRLPPVERRLRPQDALVRGVREQGRRRRHRRPRQLAGVQESDQQEGGHQIHRAELLARRAMDQTDRHAGEVRHVGVKKKICADTRPPACVRHVHILARGDGPM